MAKTLSRIKIENIGYGGIGLARMSDGKRILIKGGALPGSVVDLRIVKQRKDYIEAHITHVHSLDPAIVDGKIFCPHFFSLLTQGNKPEHPETIGCGGCKWQMLSYGNQLKLKEAIVNDAFTKIKKRLPDFTVLPIIGSPQEKLYRNKIEFSFGKYITSGPRVQAKEGASPEANPKIVLSDWSVGFHKQGEFSKIIDIHHCSLISEKANEIFLHLKSLCKDSGLPVYDQMTHQGFLRHIVIREGTNTEQFLVNLAVADNNLKQKLTKKWNGFLEVLKQDEFLKEHVTTLVITYNNGLADIIRSQDCETKTFRGDGYIYEILKYKAANAKNNVPEEQVSPDTKIQDRETSDVNEVTFRVSPFSFFQTNTLGAQQLFSQAMHMTGNIEGTILDLYCGTGSIGLSFLKAGKGENLVGIEIVEEAITDARYNAKINGLETKVLFLAVPAEKAFITNPEIRNKVSDLGLVIIDPPRDGLHKNVITTLSELKKESDFKLLYISCNPVTMVRDIELLQAEGFTIKNVQPVDMFPQTHHIECISVLT